tara:strand:- start:655 stop:999 length:345 start_codon:yes stop_codon:yes gene_type:complete
MSDKTEKSKKLKKIIQQQKKQNDSPKSIKIQKQNDSPISNQIPKQPEGIEDIRVPVSLKFLESINDLLLLANSRISWRPNELIPAGMILKDLEGMIGYYNQHLEQTKNNTDKEE